MSIKHVTITGHAIERLDQRFDRRHVRSLETDLHWAKFYEIKWLTGRKTVRRSIYGVTDDITFVLSLKNLQKGKLVLLTVVKTKNVRSYYFWENILHHMDRGIVVVRVYNSIYELRKQIKNAS